MTGRWGLLFKVITFFKQYTGQNGASFYLCPTLLRRIGQRGATVDTPFCPGLSKNSQS